MPISTRALCNRSVCDEKDDLFLCGLNLSVHSRLTQFLILGSGVFFFYLIHGILQEEIFNMDGVSDHIWFASVVQFLVCALCGLCELRKRHELSVPRASLTVYVIGGLLTVTTVAVGNEACNYVNYPTLVVFKCCKLVPLLIGGIIIQRKRYSVWKFLGCTLMTIGLSLFVLADNAVSPHIQAAEPSTSSSHAKGVLLISIAVLSDAALTNVQEHMMGTWRTSCCELITYTYAIGTAMIAARCVSESGFTGMFASAAFFGEPAKLCKLAAFGAASYLGVMCFALLVRTNGSLVAVMLNTCRRGVTIALSFVLYAKPFTYVYVLAGLIVLLGIALNVRDDEHRKVPSDAADKSKSDTYEVSNVTVS